MFQVTPDQDNESLLAHACESLASASVMASDIAAYVDSPQRHTILAIQQVIMLAELAVNRVLNNYEIPQSPNPVGASLLAKASAHSVSGCLIRRIREQARSHNETECIR
jgi:hypothetical protein